MLTEEEAKVLERYRTGDYSNLKGNLDLARILRDQEYLGRTMLRLYPPDWNDPVTPERLVELGFYGMSYRANSYELYMFYCCVRCRPSTGCWWIADAKGVEMTVPSECRPRNMQEARQLLERCGAIKETT